MNTLSKPASNLRMALMLGLISALGPLAIDMYLPALPVMAESLGGTEGQMHQTLMAFFFGLASGQLFMGPLSDKIGRRRAFLIGIGIYIAAVCGCMMVQNASTLIVLRMLQGFGSAVGMSVGMATVRDMYVGVQAVRVMSMMVLVIGVAPIVAPMLGSLIISQFAWPMIFVALGIAAAIAFLCILLFLPETTSAQHRLEFKPSRVLQTYATLIKSRQFLPYVMVAACAQAGFFAYIAGSSFFFIELHGMEPMKFSVIFAANSIGMMIAAQTSGRLISRFGTIAVVRTVGVVYALCCLALLVLTLLQVSSLVPFCILLFIAASMLPILMPCCSMMAMAAWGHVAGTASAMMGALQFGSGALATAMTGIFANGTAVPMFIAMSVCSLLSLLCSIVLLPKHFQMPTPPGPPPGAGANASGQAK